MTVVSALSLEQLTQENARLMALLSQQEQTIQSLQHQLHLFRTARFGRKSEKGVVPEQMALQFDEAIPVEEDPSKEQAADIQTVTFTRNKKGTGRKPLPPSLPYVEHVYDLTDEEKHCSCGCTLTHIRDEITEQLDVVPQMTFRVVHIRKQYACKGCEDSMKLAKFPQQPIPQSIATPGLLAAVINSKFRCHMPLYRQEAMFHEAGVSLTRGTLSNWMIKAADLLTPLVKLMEDEIQNYDIAYADETTLQVLNEKGKSPTQKSYMWLFIGGPPVKRAFVYQYHPSRSHQIPINFFSDFKGYLHADCYQAYVTLGLQESIQHVACWAHARRYFVDVAKITKKQGLAHQVITMIGQLYHLEAQLKEHKASADVIFATRINTAQPILNELKELLEQASLRVFPKSPIGHAVFYALNHWHSLKTYLHDGRLEIDNNLSERSIKPFVIGRKNWLFHGNEAGARAGSILFSLIETCKHHQVDVFSWLKYALTHVQQAHTVEQLEQLLPYNINIQILDNMRSLPDLRMPV
jgi:transposase